MLRGLSIWLAVCIAASTCRDLLPLAEYYIHRDYIREVLCINKDKPDLQCDGKCYLKKTLGEAQKQEQSKPFPPPYEYVPCILLSGALIFSPKISMSRNTPLSDCAQAVLPGAIHDIIHPPEVSSMV